MINLKNTDKKSNGAFAATAVFVSMILNKVLKKYYGDSGRIVLVISLSAVIICWCISQIIKNNNRKDMIVMLVLTASINVFILGIIIDNVYVVLGACILFLITLIGLNFFLRRKK